MTKASGELREGDKRPGIQEEAAVMEEIMQCETLAEARAVACTRIERLCEANAFGWHAARAPTAVDQVLGLTGAARVAMAQ